MMKFPLAGAFLLCAAAFSAHAEPLPAYEFQAVAASREASPDVDLDDAKNAGLAAALAMGKTVDLPDAGKRIEAMTAAGLFVRQPDGSYKPAFPVIDRAAAKAFAAIDPGLAERMAKMVEAHAKELRAAAPDLPALFLFADIPFDRWQVRNVRSRFLGGYPPPRAGKEFYIADIESGAAGFYSHGEQSFAKRTVVTFGPDSFEPPSEQQLSGYPTITRSAYARLPALASSLTADLIALLEADRPVLEAAYRASPLSRTTSFREFGLWWYHFLYAQATARLIADKLIDQPAAVLVVVED